MENGFKNKLFWLFISIVVIVTGVIVYDNTFIPTFADLGFIFIGAIVTFAIINIGFGIYNQFIKK